MTVRWTLRETRHHAVAGTAVAFATADDRTLPLREAARVAVKVETGL